MRVIARALGAACCALMSAPSFAALVTITAAGEVSYISARDQNGIIPVPAGSISVGDSYQFKITFDASSVALNPYWVGEPRVADYVLQSAHASLSIGASHTQTFAIGPDTWGDLLIFNGHPSLAGADGQDLGLIQQNVLTVPFDLGAGSLMQTFRLMAADFSGSARDNVELNDLKDFAVFPVRQASIVFMNISTGEYVEVAATIDTTSIAMAPVPEPASWAMMFAGLAFAGGALRHRRTRVTFGR